MKGDAHVSCFNVSQERNGWDPGTGERTPFRLADTKPNESDALCLVKDFPPT